MGTAQGYSSDVAFTPTVKSVQARRGSRRAYARMEEKGSWQTHITPDLAQFIAAQTSIFIATANKEGQPYIQHHGGRPAFSGCSTTGRLDSRISPAIGNTLAKAISPTIPKRISS